MIAEMKSTTKVHQMVAEENTIVITITVKDMHALLLIYDSYKNDPERLTYDNYVELSIADVYNVISVSPSEITPVSPLDTVIWEIKINSNKNYNQTLDKIEFLNNQDALLIFTALPKQYYPYDKTAKQSQTKASFGAIFPAYLSFSFNFTVINEGEICKMKFDPMIQTHPGNQKSCFAPHLLSIECD